MSTDDQVQLNGELKIQGRSLTFVRCFLVSDRSGIATLPELLVRRSRTTTQ
jgi:hypothetical protein